MSEMIDYFLKDPIDDAYIKKIAFQYFDSDYSSAQNFLNHLKEQNNAEKALNKLS
jgi:hypothetical protein|tara:strand:+ start:37 stop:201 length:165 start_codon:yes stop_codon:yes gene_type:complete